MIHTYRDIHHRELPEHMQQESGKERKSKHKKDADNLNFDTEKRKDPPPKQWSPNPQPRSKGKKGDRGPFRGGYDRGGHNSNQSRWGLSPNRGGKG